MLNLSPRHVAKSSVQGVKKFFNILGPGLITGAADDDPSGIATYSITGAQQGMSLLWMSWLTWPLMAAVQMMCARIGLVTGLGLAQALCKKLPKWLVITFCATLFIANTINIAADLSGMADAMQMLTGFNGADYGGLFIVAFGLTIAAAIVYFPYHKIANVMKWLAFSLFAYVVTPFIVHPDWLAIGHATFSVSLTSSIQNWSIIVAVLGTTISPYLFFWQTAQEVEEEKQIEIDIPIEARLSTHQMLKHRMLDVGVGTLLSNLVMYFIILTAALTLNAHGLTNVSSSRDVAEALVPLAGNLAMLIYTVGIVAGGVLAIPVLAGSAGYAFAEVFKWNQGLDKKLNMARDFYTVIVCSVAGGVVLNLLQINPMRALLWSAVVNGVLAPFLLVGIILVARDVVIMKGKPSSRLNQLTVALTTTLMFAAAFGLFWM